MWLTPCQVGISFISEEDYIVAHLVRSPGQRFGYLYDLGDRWQHEVLVSSLWAALLISFS